VSTGPALRPAAATEDVAAWHRPLRSRWFPPAVLLLGWLVAWPLTGHYGNPDGPSYAVVARLWLEGDLPAAVNAYWGPLLSWAAMPLLAVGVDDLLALRLVLLVGASLTFAPLRTLCRSAGASPEATQTLLVAVAPILVYAASFGLYADVLMVMALLRSLAALSVPAPAQRPTTAVRAGLWAAVAFLARAYALPVALVMFPVASLLHGVATGSGRRTRTVLRVVGPAVAAFALVAGAWIATLSAVYGEPTYSTSAAFNAELVAPGSAGNPFNVRGLHEPVRDGGFSAWEEPSELPVPVRSSAAVGDDGGPGDPDLGHRVSLGLANARIVVGSMLRRGAPLLALAAVALAGAVAARRWPPVAVSLPLVTGAAAAGGLTLIIAIERYTWLPILATVPAAAVGFDRLLAGRRRWLPAAGAALVAVTTVTSALGLAPRVGEHAEVTAAAAALGDGQLVGRAATAESWQRAHLLCFRAGCDFLGRPTARDAAGAAEELAAADVDHLLVFAGDEDELPGLPAPDGAGPGSLTVYAVTDDGLVAAYRVDGEDLVDLTSETTAAGSP
jgi:hypothetical protein